jgi:hypothetical protein
MRRVSRSGPGAVAVNRTDPNRTPTPEGVGTARDASQVTKRIRRVSGLASALVDWPVTIEEAFIDRGAPRSRRILQRLFAARRAASIRLSTNPLRSSANCTMNAAAASNSSLVQRGAGRRLGWAEADVAGRPLRMGVRPGSRGLLSRLGRVRLSLNALPASLAPSSLNLHLRGVIRTDRGEYRIGGLSAGRPPASS